MQYYIAVALWPLHNYLFQLKFLYLYSSVCKFVCVQAIHKLSMILAVLHYDVFD
jgi:hypothetical protein